jgi:hypothetical protein
LGGEVDFALGSDEAEDCFEVGDVCFEEMVSPEVAESCGEAGWYIFASGKEKAMLSEKVLLEAGRDSS